MIYAFDAYYRDNVCQTAAATFNNWSDVKPLHLHTAITTVASEYIPGQFYKRELPGILQVLNYFPPSENDLIVIDGYVHLDDEGKYGLGGHLYESLGQRVPIVGVAKKKYKTVNARLREVTRGKSLKPLYITAVGVDLDRAAQWITNMAGPYRIPTLLKIVDERSRAE
ncbi:endonuclease V [Lewinella sp. 4G2]|uniref:endonuclease V n=1 Tax=Lewinella sp. 4G2 TaxID=1803372 RepID=UPI0007B4790C|nr:endonuclease V [Lewinella sp. 4G2]OAV45438.1 hypothetical protein A3850_013475 [Lewinella sp. 4G2]